MKFAIDCRMSGMSGIGVYLDTVLAYFISENTNDSFLLIGDQSKLKGYVDNSNCQILHTEIPILSLKEMFCFPTKEINRCDVFYSPNSNIPFGIKIPIFSTIHDVVFFDVHGLTSRIGWLIRWIMIWRTVKISKIIFTVSNFSKERILFHFKTNKNIVVTYSGISHDLQIFSKLPTAPYTFPYIIYVGNIKKHKGISILLNAYYQARKNGFIPKLVIVGSFENFRTADDTIVTLMKKENNDVIFTGKISNNQLYNTIAHARLLIQPSLYEGFGLPPLESLYLGCNVLISDIPVFREIYDKLPVIYFDANNVNDLKEKMIISATKTEINPELKIEIINKYNLNNSAQIILKQIKMR